jgi:hypothetical protein
MCFICNMNGWLVWEWMVIATRRIEVLVIVDIQYYQMTLGL